MKLLDLFIWPSWQKALGMSPIKPKVLTPPERQHTQATATRLRREYEMRMKEMRSRQQSNRTGGMLLSPLRKLTPTLKERLGA